MLNIGGFYTWANLNFGTSNYANSNVASYLPTYSGLLSAGNIITTNGVFWSNGTPYSSGGGGSTYGNANVAAYLPTYTGNIGASTITATGAVSAASFSGDGSGLTNIVTQIIAGANVTISPPKIGRAHV